MGTDEQSYSQILGESWRVLCGVERMIGKTRAHHKNAESIDQNTSGLAEYGSDPLHIRCGCVAQCSLRTPNSGNTNYLWLFCLPFGTFSYYWVGSFSLDVRISVRSYCVVH